MYLWQGFFFFLRKLWRKIKHKIHVKRKSSDNLDYVFLVVCIMAELLLLVKAAPHYVRVSTPETHETYA